jgi:hypothetical protein
MNETNIDKNSDEMWYNLYAHPEHYEMIDGLIVCKPRFTYSIGDAIVKVDDEIQTKLIITYEA